MVAAVRVCYDGLAEVDRHLVELLQAHERVVQDVLQKAERGGAMRWEVVCDANENQVFDLFNDANPHERVARVSPLDLTLTFGEFERLLWESLGTG
jgi:hypothetical protein